MSKGVDARKRKARQSREIKGDCSEKIKDRTGHTDGSFLRSECDTVMSDDMDGMACTCRR